MALLYSIAVAAAARLGYKLAEDRKWLPGGLYRQLALDQLKSGDLQRAAQYSTVALQKNPGDEKAGLVRELIAMRSDARLAALLRSVGLETDALQSLEKENSRIERRIHSIARLDGVDVTAAWFFFLGALACYVISYLLFFHSSRAVAASLLAGGAVLMTVFAASFIKSVPDRRMQRSLERMELRAGQRAMRKETAMRRDRLLQLQESIELMKIRALDHEKN